MCLSMSHIVHYLHPQQILYDSWDTSTAWAICGCDWRSSPVGAEYALGSLHPVAYPGVPFSKQYPAGQLHKFGHSVRLGALAWRWTLTVVALVDCVLRSGTHYSSSPSQPHKSADLGNPDPTSLSSSCDCGWSANVQYHCDIERTESLAFKAAADALFDMFGSCAQADTYCS